MLVRLPRCHRQQDGSHAPILPSAGTRKTILSKIIGQITWLCPLFKLVIQNVYISTKCRRSKGDDRFELSQWYMTKSI